MPTKIPYADETVNAGVGCSHSGMIGCDNCWAKDKHDQRHEAYLAGKKVPQQYAKRFSEVQLRPERLERVLHWRKPRRIFWCSMSDLFHEDVPDEYIWRCIDTMIWTPRHAHLILTKRIERALSIVRQRPLLPRHENIWWGISCSTQDNLDKMSRYLFQIPAAHYWLSTEPLLQEIDIDPHLAKRICDGCGKNANEIRTHAGSHWVSGAEPNLDEPCGPIVKTNGFSWIVVGCESIRRRPGRFCEDEKKWWAAARDIVWQCKDAPVDVYVKQGPVNGKVATDPKDFPEDMRIREIPK